MGAEPIPVQFGTQSDPGRYGPEAGPRLINAFAEVTQEGRTPTPLYCTPGLDLFATVSGGGRCRGLSLVDDVTLLALSGSKLVTMDLGGGVTEVGTMTGNRNVFMARNNATPTQVAIVNDGLWYVFSDGTLSAESPDADLPPPSSVLFLDQRMIFTIPDGRLFWTALNDSTDVNALSFATAEAAPDGLIRGFRHRLDAWLFGGETTEIWRSTADTDSPFQRVSGGFIQKGCSAAHSVASFGEVVFWIGNDDVPYAAPGYTLQPLIHGPVCRDIENTTDKTSIVGFTYSRGGYGFWEISGPDWTWVFCISTEKWFEKTSVDMSRTRGHHGIRFGGNAIVGDNSTNTLYKMNIASFEENGSMLVFKISSPPLHAYPKRISIDRFYADFVTGVGINSSDVHAAQPMAIMRYLDDGGRTYSAPNPTPIGRQGSYETRAVWNNLGITGRQGRIWELSVSSPVIRGFISAAVEGDLIGT